LNALQELFVNLFFGHTLQSRKTFTAAAKLKTITGKTTFIELLQCNELNRGHPTIFYQSQDEFRTKESEFVHFGAITNEGPMAKS